MHQPTGSQRPIGYWLKEADRAITAHVDEAQRANGVSRLEWQVLNTIREAQRPSPDHLAAGLHMFLDRPTLDNILTGFQARGWIDLLPGGDVTLTESGQRAHGQIQARQQEVRQQAMEGITADEYATVLRVLQRIVTNLEGSAT